MIKHVTIIKFSYLILFFSVTVSFSKHDKSRKFALALETWKNRLPILPLHPSKDESKHIQYVFSTLLLFVAIKLNTSRLLFPYLNYWSLLTSLLSI